jgi:formate/nitrite transporter FocA (FNT family)
MWMPIMLFFYMTFEHSIVNMFLFPSGLLLGGHFTLMDYLIWNEIPPCWATWSAAWPSPA